MPTKLKKKPKVKPAREPTLKERLDNVFAAALSFRAELNRVMGLCAQYEPGEEPDKTKGRLYGLTGRVRPFIKRGSVLISMLQSLSAPLAHIE